MGNKKSTEAEVHKRELTEVSCLYNICEYSVESTKVRH